jgi:predicted phage tail protein
VTERTHEHAQFSLSGAKGGGRTPTEASDTLRSVQRAEVVDLLGEGQIGGLVNGLKSVYLDNVPVENADGSRNFDEFAYYISLGGPSKTAPPHGYGDVQTEVAVGVQVSAALPVVRTIADATVDAVRLTIGVAQLVETKDNGDRVGSQFEWAIDVQSAGGGYVERYRDVVSGKCTSAYSKAVRVDLASTGPAPWDVRVRRVSPNSANANIINAFSWTSYTAISGVRMLYRNSAVVGLSFSAEQFSAVPLRAYDVMGLSDLDIPTNYNPLTRTYAGNWNGIFKQGWTNNPAWVLYNLVQHPRYGLGEYITQLPDKWVLYRLALWCDVPLPDGRGGTEPRYSINTCITQQGEALRLLQDLCAVFRGALLHAGNTLGVTWDQPGDPVALYTPANVVDGVFNYSDGSLAAKKSSCTCWFNDRSQMGKRMPATWEDADLVAKYGLRSMEIDPIGVSTPAQALRMAKWALYTNEVEDSTVAFRVGGQGVAARVGEVFQIADPSESAERLGGRVVTATASEVTLDAPVDLAPGQSYTLWVTMPDAADPGKLTAQERPVTNTAGRHTVLTVSPAFSAVPMVQTMWMLEGTDVAPTLWRYLSISEVRNGDSALEYEIVGMRHDPDKWALIEAGQPLTPSPTRRLADVVPRVTNLTLAEVAYLNGASRKIRTTVSWTPPARGLRYFVSWRLDNGPWTGLTGTSANVVDVDGLNTGTFEVRVVAQNALGNYSPAVEGTLVLTGAMALPPNVVWLPATMVPAGIELSWTPYSLANAGDTELRVGAGWDAGERLFRGRADTYTWVTPAAGTYTVWARHFDASGTWASAVPQQLQVVWDGTTLIKLLDVLANSQIFRLETNGTTTPASITLTANGQNLAGAPTFTVTAGTGTLTGTGNSRTIAGTSLGSDLVTIEVTWDGQVDRVSLFRLRDGSASFGWGLVNEHQTVACDAAGNPLAGQLPLASQMLVARGGTLLATGVAYSVGTVSGFSGVSINATTGVIAITGITANGASAEFIATVDGTQLRKTLTANKSLAGANGLNQYTVELFQRTSTSTPPAKPGANDITYTFASGAISGTLGAWSVGVPSSGGDFLWVTRGLASSSGPSDVIPSAEWSNAASIAQTGAAGVSTAQVLAYKRSASAPTDNPGAVTYTFASASITTPSVLANGWQRTIPAGTDPVYFVAASAAGSGPTDDIAANEWSGAVLLVQNGSNGLNVATVQLYQRTSTSVPPAKPSANDITYTFASGAISGTLGAWSVGVPSSGGAYLWVVRATAAASATADTILSSEWSNAELQAQNGADGGTGPQGPQGPQGNTGNPGSNGTRTARLVMYQWSRAQPVVFPSGSSTYTWAGGGYTAPSSPNGWSLQPSTPIPGATLWAVEQLFSDQGTSATSSVTWAATTAYPIGATGANGANGTDAAQTGVYVGTVYQQSGFVPSAPTGGSFDFSTGTFNPPAGWSATKPATSSTPTYMVEFKFATAAPSITVNGGTWAAPVVDGHAPGSGQTNTFTIDLYLLASSEPPTPTASGATYTINGDVFSAGSLTAGWSRTRPSATATMSVWRARVSVAASNPASAAPLGTIGAPVLVHKAFLHLRTTLDANATAYGITGAWSDQLANRVVWLAVNNVLSPITALADTSHVRVGDSVTMTNGTSSDTRYWSGTGWVLAGIYTSGNLIAGGVISAGVSLNTSGFVKADGATTLSMIDPMNGNAVGRSTSGSFNVGGGAFYGMFAETSNPNGAGVYGYNSSSTGFAGHFYGGQGVRAIASSEGGAALVARGKLDTVGTASSRGIIASAVGQNGAAIEASGGVDIVTGQRARSIIANGNALFNDEVGVVKRLTLSATATAPLKMTPVATAALPPVESGGVALHQDHGLVVSNGSFWFRFNVGLVPV